MILKKLFLIYWKLVQFQEVPENTPYSHFLVVTSALSLFIILTIQWSFSDFDFSNDLLLTAFIATSLVLSFIIYTYAILFFRGLSSRLVQTITCLCSGHFIIHLLASPLFLLDPYLLHTNLKNPLILFLAVIYLFVTLGLSIWQFVITAYIYKYAMNISNIQSVMAAFGLIAVNILTVSFWR